MHCVRRQKKSELKEPTKIRKIAGDGNCLFRALSAEITNSQDHHTLINNALVTFMTSEDTSHIFSNYCGQDIKVYVANSQMSRLGIWATDVEISAAATFLQTDVFVHTQVNPTMSKWLRYQPLTKISLSKYWNTQNKDEAIYLRNACSHFDVVDGV